MAEADSQSGGTSQSSSGQQSQSGSQTGTQASADASQTTQSQQSSGQGGQQTQTATSRPEWLPETFWDDQKKEPKGGDFRKAYDELSAFKAADDSRRLSLPQKPDDYKIELPKDFKAPEGVEMKFNEQDPSLAQARQAAQEMGLTQEQFSKLLGVYAGNRAAEVQSFKAAKDAEVAKLGPAGPARIDALTTWAKAFFGEAGAKTMTDSLWTADQVKLWETVVQRASGQHNSSFSQSHRTAETQPGRVSAEEFDKMGPRERLDYVRQFDQSQFNGAGR